MAGTAAWQLRGNIGFYDALYVTLAARLGLPLLTTDTKLTSTPIELPCHVERIASRPEHGRRHT